MTEATRKATLIIPRVDETTVREADHRARLALYLGVASVFVLPLALPALGLWSTVKNTASLGGRDNGRVGRNFALLALALWLAVPAGLLMAGVGSLASRAAAARATDELIKVQNARDAVAALHATAVTDYASDPEHCPKTSTVDAWGNAYSIVCSPTGILVVSNGPDGARYSARRHQGGRIIASRTKLLPPGHARRDRRPIMPR